MKKKLYLANPLGFSKQANNFIKYKGYNIGKSLFEKDKDNLVSNIIKECEKLKDETNCPNEQVVALLSVIASNFAPIVGN